MVNFTFIFSIVSIIILIIVIVILNVTVIITIISTFIQCSYTCSHAGRDWTSGCEGPHDNRFQSILRSHPNHPTNSCMNVNKPDHNDRDYVCYSFRKVLWVPHLLGMTRCWMQGQPHNVIVH